MAAPMKCGPNHKRIIPESEVRRIINDSESNLDDSDQDPTYIMEDDNTRSSSDILTGDEGCTENANLKGKGKKRQRMPHRWERSVRKAARNMGMPYTNTKGVNVPGKTLTPLQQHVCRFNCTTHVTEEERQIIFDKFWEIGDFNQQNAFLCGTIKLIKTKHRQRRKQPETNKSVVRNFSRKYGLTTKHGYIEVCKSFFLATLTISNGRLDRALKKQLAEGGLPSPDGRGKHENRKKVSDESSKIIKDHINSFPKYESHYTREKQATRKYLSPDLSLSQMYRLYVEQCTTSGIKPEKQWVYRRIFVTEFNLSFHAPRKDTCKTCDTLKVKIDISETEAEKRALECELEVHHRKAKKVRTSMSEEKFNKDPAYASFTFDLEKTLPTPQIPTGIVYYKRQLWTYNLGVHSLSDGSATMFMWHEGIAKRGANEVGSCVYKYVKALSDRGVKKVTAYSDSCGGQNRNIKMAMFWSHIVATTPITEVNHKFMISGHSYLPNDQDFGVIEVKRKKATHIYVPNDLMELTAKARIRDPFKVIKMSQSDFLSSDEGLAEQIINRKKCTDGGDVNWLKIQWISFKKEAPLNMFLKYTTDNDAHFFEVDLSRKSRTRRIDAELESIVLPPLYTAPIPINPLKIKDLIDLLNLIPSVYHSFYRNLAAGEGAALLHPEITEDETESDSV